MESRSAGCFLTSAAANLTFLYTLKYLKYHSIDNVKSKVSLLQKCGQVFFFLFSSSSFL